MKGRKLKAWEALKLLQEQSYIENGNGEITNVMHWTELERLFSEYWYEYIEPEKPKSLSERWADKYSIEHGGRVFIKEVYNWLKQQEGEK